MMHWIALGMASLLALAIIAIGALYLATPNTATRSFGLPLPDGGADTVWWLRLKGVRDVTAGLAVLASMIWSGPGAVGIVLLAEACIPLGDMLVVLAAKGSTKSALGMHGVTAVVMVLTAIPLLMVR